MLDTIIIVNVNRIIPATMAEATSVVGNLDIVTVVISVMGNFDSVTLTISGISIVVTEFVTTGDMAIVLVGLTLLNITNEQPFTCPKFNAMYCERVYCAQMG